MTRVLVFIGALAIATSANAVLPICTKDSECPSTQCGQGVCIEGTCGTDVTLRKGQVCRPSAGPCDPAEVCDGVHTTCPGDVLYSRLTVCRPAAGPCDVAERCDGRTAGCPADGLADSSVVCRAAAGACDVEERCTGTSAACPADKLVPQGTICRPAANDCDVAESCTGGSAVCPADSSAPPGTACENVSACVSGGTCAANVCIGGTPELTFAPDVAEFSDANREVKIAVRHTGSGGPITLTGASVSPAGTFTITSAPSWPVPVPSGTQVELTVTLAPDVAPGEYGSTLLVQANTCADQPMQLHAMVSAPAPDAGPGDAGPGDAGDPGSGGSGSPDAGSPASGGSAQTGASGSAHGGGGCTSGSAPGPSALLLLCWLAARRRARPAR